MSAPVTSHWDSRGSLDAHIRLIQRQVKKSMADGQTVQLAARIVSGGYDIVSDPRTGMDVPAILAWDQWYRAPNDRNCRMRDDVCEITQIWDFVVLNTRYVLDPNDTDTFRTLRRALEAGSCDCDDFTIIFASLLKSIGFRVAARVISLPGSSHWAHVYPLVATPKEPRPNQALTWIPLDVTVQDVRPGWEYPSPDKVRDFEL